jgi:hypothetical protein
MFSVLFEVYPKSDQWDAYLGYAKMLRPELEQVEGFVDNIGVTTPNVKNCTFSNLDYSFEAANGRKGLNEPLRSRPAACQV